MTPKTLQIANGLQLPLSAVTESIGILAKRRAGKSTTARRLAEQLHRAGQQVVVADPKGDWWGLRFARDGKRPGLPFIVLGGEHGDVDLEATGGELVASLVVEQRASVILDLSRFRKHEVCRFMTAFMETLYRLKAKEANRTPLMLIIDEADAIAPQKPFGEEARMVGAASDLVRRGGQRGIGVTMLTQRSAVLSKDLLTQIGILIVLQTIAPQDRKAIDAWIDIHGTPEQRAELMASLPTLIPGEGWCWAPGWPSGAGIFRRERFLLPETFDSSKTPEGGAIVEVRNGAMVDLDAFRRDMAATIEKAKADDPKELRRRIADLERELSKKASLPPARQAPSTPPVIVEKPVITDAQLARVEKLVDRVESLVGKAQAALAAPVAEVRRQVGELAAAVTAVRQPVLPLPRPTPAARVNPPAAPRSAIDRPADTAIAPVQQRVLDALGELEQLGAKQPARELVALLAGYTHLQSKGFVNAMGALRSAGLISYPADGAIALTDAGRAAVHFRAQPTTPAQVQERVCDLLGGASSKILRPLIGAYPEALSREEVATAAGYGHLQSKGFVNALGRLRALGFVDYPDRGTVRAQPVLFLEA